MRSYNAINSGNQNDNSESRFDIIKSLETLIYQENGQIRWQAAALKDIMDFTYSCLLGYFLTEGINAVTNLVDNEAIYATTLLTVAPYVLSRCIDQGMKIMTSHDQHSFAPYRTFAQRVMATGVTTAAGFAIGKLGVFQNLSNSDIIPLTAAGMITGKTVELLLEKRNSPCPG